MFEGIKVRHKSGQEGVIKSCDGHYITVDFGNEESEFVFPDAIGRFLDSDDDLLIQTAEKEKAIKDKKIEDQKKAEKEKIEKISKIRGTVSGKDSDFETPLLGKKSEDIIFDSDEEFYEAIGYLAKPGRIAFYQAEITEDKEKQFVKLFPNQYYKVIKTNYGKDGKVTKQGCQFRINLNNIYNCPSFLLRNINQNERSWAGRINRSKFALRLVQNNGFSFGYSQDFENIKKFVPQKYIDSFMRGYNL